MQKNRRWGLGQDLVAMVADVNSTASLVYLSTCALNMCYDLPQNLSPRPLQECLDSLWGLLDQEAVYDATRSHPACGVAIQ